MFIFSELFSLEERDYSGSVSFFVGVESFSFIGDLFFITNSAKNGEVLSDTGAELTPLYKSLPSVNLALLIIDA